MRFLFVHLAVAFHLTAAEAPIRQLYVFGDSYSDTGNGYVDGNGPTAVAYFAGHLGIQLLPASDPKAGPRSSLNFAVSGAGTGKGAGRKVGDARLGIGMENQVDDFAARVKSKQVQFDPATTLFYLAGGLNDRRLESAETVRNLEARVRSLAGLGATRFAIALLPTAIPSFRDVSLRLNPEIEKVAQLQLPGVRIRLSQWGPFFDKVMQNPKDYGIENTADACAGRAIFNEDTTACKTPQAHYFYHAGHPSTAVHKAVGQMLYAEFRGLRSRSTSEIQERIQGISISRVR